MKVRWHLPHESLPTLIEAIEEVGIPSVWFVKRPRFDANAAGDRLIDQLQSDLRFRQKVDIVGNVVFFRRAGSLVQCSGRYIRAAIRQWKQVVA